MTKTLEGCSQVAINVPLPPATSATNADAPTQEDSGALGNKTLPLKPSPDKYDKLQSKTPHSSVCSSNILQNFCDSLPVEEKSVTNLDDEGLRALLDEAITYKTPKDREGKSKLFNSLLTDAEDEIRKKHAYNASGPARHFSTTAKKRHRQRRQPSSISENLTHGGSLNDLAKQELYESTKMQRPKTVSTRQREGGSLPCNVNAGASPVDKEYFIEECAKLEERNKKTYSDAIPHEQKFNLDDGLHLMQNDPVGDAGGDRDRFLSRFQSRPNFCKYRMPEEFVHLKIPNCSNSDQVEMDSKDFSFRHVGLIKPESLAPRPPLEKKLDENGNAVASSSISTACTANNTNAKRKSKQKKSEKEKVIRGHEIEGHRADIINNIDKLLNFIDGNEEKAKPKKLHKQHSNATHPEEKSKTNSKRSRKKSVDMLQKANSMEEISTTTMEDFSFDGSDNMEKTPLRSTKSNAERALRAGTKGWVSSSEYVASSTSCDNSDFICVTKKKRSKKRRNSLGSRRDDNGSSCEKSRRPVEFHSLRASTPESRKSTISAPPSEKSGDSSDNESSHSLPLDGANQSHQISYADIAKSSDRPKWNRPTSERRKADNAAVVTPPEDISVVHTGAHIGTPIEVVPVAVTAPASIDHESTKPKETDTDLSSLQNWPEIRNNKVNSAKSNSMDNASVPAGQDWPSIISNGSKQALSVKTQQNQQSPLAQPISQQQWQTKPDNKSSSFRSKPPTANNKINVSTIAPASATAGKKGQGHWNNAMSGELMQQVHQQHHQVLNIQIINKPIPIPEQQPQYSHQPVATQTDVHQQDLEDQVVLNNTQQVIQQVSEQQSQLLFTYKMPPNIRDVQSIELMQMQSLQAAKSHQGALSAEGVCAEVTQACPHRTCTFCMHAAPPLQQHVEDAAVAITIPPVTGSGSHPVEKHRPPVVILNSVGGDCEMTTDITFGFGINEQLLSGDVCADFCSRFVEPEFPTSSLMQVEKLVNYIGTAWDDCLMQVHTGKVRYYKDGS